MAAVSFDVEMAKVYDQHGPRRFVPGYTVFQQLIALLLDAELADDASILVMAAGGGAEIINLAATRDSWRLVGVDPSEAMLDLARSKLTTENLGRIHLKQGYATDAPEGPFDAATSCLVMSFLADDGAKLDYFQQVRRRLRPGAPALFVEMAWPQTAQAWERFLKLYKMHGRRNGADESLIARAASSQSSMHYVSAERQRALMMEAGFASIEIFFQSLHILGWVARA